MSRLDAIAVSKGGREVCRERGVRASPPSDVQWRTLSALGWALCVRGWLTVGYVVVLFVLLNRKSALEERWLSEKYPTYGDYQRRVCKLVPFIY
jgi:steroid 5-alpha reductase family enzyme